MMLTVFRIRAFSAWHDTRGIVLPLTFFILVLLAGLVAALLSVGAMESQISANLLRGHQAFNLAEAGAERAMAAFVATSTLVGNAACSPCPGAATTLFTNQALGSVGTYTVTYQPIGPSTVLVQSTGQSSIGTVTQKIQVVVTAPPASSAFAIVGDDTELSGNATIHEDPISLNGGSVYGLTNTSLKGNSRADQTATSHGATSSKCAGCTDASHVGDVANSGYNKPAQALETKSALDYKSQADFIMQDDGTILVQKACPSPRCVPAVVAGQVVGPAGSSGAKNAPFSGWRMDSSAAGDWHFFGATTPPNGTYYASQELAIDKNVGSAGTPWQATLLSGDGTRTGELEINGICDSQGNSCGNGQNVYMNAYLTVDGEPILAVAGRVRLGSDHTVNATLTGDLISTTMSRCGNNCDDGSGTSITMASNVNLTGQLRSDGQVLMSGNATITYKAPVGGGSSGAPQIVSWTRLAQ